jgi:NADH-quinone oxidoreductase subunit C
VNAAIFDKITERLAPAAGEASVAHGILVLKIARESLVRVVTALRNDFAFDMFLDVTAVDWPAGDPRFEVVWHFYSTVHHVRIRVKARVTAADPAVDSLVPLYGSAAFMERECHEMYGIGFNGNADLRPLLLYEGFTGHPLRKDYPKHREQPLVPYRNTR